MDHTNGTTTGQPPGHTAMAMTPEEWADWRSQLRHALDDASAVRRLLGMPPEEACGRLPMKITPYYLNVLMQSEAAPLRRTVVPSQAEERIGPEEYEDPLGETAHQTSACVVHTYPGKVLFLATDQCAVHCRYCTRSRWLGHGACSERDWQAGIEYIRSDSTIRDVLISGGDPLMMEDARLDELLDALRSIAHVEIIRIGTKMPAALPQRITPWLLEVLKKYHPLWMVIHFTHASELTPECAAACGCLADAGIPLAAQTVLLKGVNDDEESLCALMEGLLKIRVRPYYLLQCDPVIGSSHFRVPIRKGQAIIRSLHGRTTGLAIPAYMVDAPGGGGKVPVMASFVEGYDGTHWQLNDCQGGIKTYYDPEDT
ncbi:MAG: KamA family radical SAM protein [Kiritimatiellae bacterium]|nr:KamA family radical SAM protein [Kiritimatiellia bacterium]